MRIYLQSKFKEKNFISLGPHHERADSECPGGGEEKITV